MPTNPPAIDTPDPTGDLARSQAWAMLNSRHSTSHNWATWAAGLMNQKTSDMMESFRKGSAVDSELNELANLLNSAPGYTPGAIQGYTAPTAIPLLSVPAYSAPAAPSYATVPSYSAPTVPGLIVTPSYSAPTLGTIKDIPAVEDIAIGAVPSTVINFSNNDFSDTLISSLRNRIEADLAGITAAEAAVFARHTDRETSKRADAFNEITTQFSARGWDMPSGALLAKQTEMNNESNKRLTDVSADIMAESAKQSLTSALQILDLLGRLNDSKIMRDFEAAKTAVMLSIDGFKATIDVAMAKANLNRAAIDATVASNDGTIKVYTGKIEGQLAPIKGIADANNALVSMYKSQVEGAITPITAAVEANKGIAESYKAQVEGATAPIAAIANANQSIASVYRTQVDAAIADMQGKNADEDYKIKQVETDIKKFAVRSDLLDKATQLKVHTALQEFQLQVTSLQGLAQSAAQMVASSIGSVHASAGFSFQGSSSTQYKGD